MAKDKNKKALSAFLKKVKQNSKSILKLLKGLKKTESYSPRYNAILNKALELYENGGAAVTVHRDAPRRAESKAAATKKAVAKKK